jgi:hypothetical protein
VVNSIQTCLPQSCTIALHRPHSRPLRDRRPRPGSRPAFHQRDLLTEAGRARRPAGHLFPLRGEGRRQLCHNVVLPGGRAANSVSASTKMRSLMQDAAYYRRRAEGCLQQSRNAPPERQARLLQWAHVFNRFADEVEAMQSIAGRLPRRAHRTSAHALANGRREAAPSAASRNLGSVPSNGAPIVHRDRRPVSGAPI